MEDLGRTRKSTERDFKNAFLAAMKQEGWACTKVETGATKIGVADVYATSKAEHTSMWIEFKSTVKVCISTYLHGSRMLPLRPGQEQFLWATGEAGVKCYVVLECEDGYLAVPYYAITERRILVTRDCRYRFKTGDRRSDLLAVLLML